jgi:hypothetical protein
MELASMLAGEPFSDAPRAVCPVIGEFLRTYNDVVDDDRRQALYSCAAKVVGSRGSERQARARAEYLNHLVATVRLKRHPWMRWFPRRVRVGEQRRSLVAARAARLIAADVGELELKVIDVVDDLLALGADGGASAAPRARNSRSVPQGMVDFRQSVEALPERR